MTKLLAIDLGNTTLGVAFLRTLDQPPELLRLGSSTAHAPARIHVSSAGTVFGDAAIASGLRDANGLLGGLMRRVQAISRTGTLDGFDIADHVGAYFRSTIDAAIASIGTPPEELVVLRPQGWSTGEVEVLAEIAGSVGIDRVRLVGDGLAVAAYFRSRAPMLQWPLLVFDFGGTTLKTTVVDATNDELRVIGESQTLDRLGGADLDEIVFEQCVDSLGHPAATSDPVVGQILRGHCALAKEQLSSADSATMSIDLVGQAHSVVLSRSDFEARLEPTLQIAIDTARRTIERAGLEPEDIGHVVLAGGSSQIPLVAAMLQSGLGRPVERVANLQDIAVLGALEFDAGASAGGDAEQRTDTTRRNAVAGPTEIGHGPRSRALLSPNRWSLRPTRS